jgi:thiazole synthase ThiGH ThiG subunit
VDKVVNLGGERPVKLEVLTDDHSWINNSAVIEATKFLKTEKNLEVWPLIAPNINDFSVLNNMNLNLIRVLGSRISSKNGLDDNYKEIHNKILDIKKEKVMLDGGIGGVQDVINAFNLGFDCVLVNTCLFVSGSSPSKELQKIISGIENLEINKL